MSAQGEASRARNLTRTANVAAWRASAKRTAAANRLRDAGKRIERAAQMFGVAARWLSMKDVQVADIDGQVCELNSQLEQAIRSVQEVLVTARFSRTAARDDAALINRSRG